MFARGMRPLRVEKVWVRFQRGRRMHLVEREVYSEGPSGVSFLHGIGACGKTGLPLSASTNGVLCPRCPSCDRKASVRRLRPGIPAGLRARLGCAHPEGCIEPAEYEQPKAGAVSYWCEEHGSVLA